MRTILIFAVILMSCSACRKDPPPPPDLTTGIQVTGDDYLLDLQTDAGSISFVVSEDGEILVDDADLITVIICEGDLSLDFDKIFKKSPHLTIVEAGPGTISRGDLSHFLPSIEVFNVNEGEMTGEPLFGQDLIIFRINLGHDVAFDVEKLPAGMKILCINSGRVYGSITESFPEDMTRFVVHGISDLGGDYGLIKKMPSTFSIKGQNTISSYTKGVDKFSGVVMKQFLHTGIEGHGLTSTEIDDILWDLSSTTWTGLKRISLTGSHAPRTPRSTLAVIKLEAMGVKVETN